MMKRVEQEQDRLRVELLNFLKVDPYGMLLADPEEEEEEKEAIVEVEGKPEGSRKSPLSSHIGGAPRAQRGWEDLSDYTAKHSCNRSVARVSC